MITPINRWKLKGKSKEFLICAEKFTNYSVKTIYANKDIFSDLLESISPSERHSYQNDIPFGDKNIVPLK